MEKWKKILLRSLSDTDIIAEKFDLPADELRKVNSVFPCRIPHAWLKKFTSPEDPLFRQCVPDPAELIQDEDLMIDPLGEIRFKKSEVIVQKYPDRCLFLVSGECAM